MIVVFPGNTYLLFTIPNILKMCMYSLKTNSFYNDCLWHVDDNKCFWIADMTLESKGQGQIYVKLS